MPIHHSFVSGVADDAGQPQAVQPSHWNADHAIDTYVDLPRIDTPAIPPADLLRFYAERLGGRMFAAVRGPSGLDYPLGPALFSNAVGMLLPGTGTAPVAWGIAHNNTGTASHPTLDASALPLSSVRRVRFATGTTAPSGAGTRSNVALCWRGNAAGLGGFFFAIRCGMGIVPASVTNAFVGLRNTTAVIAAGTEPSALVNVLGFGFDRGQTTWRFFANDASGAATGADLGSGFPVNTTALFDLMCYAPPNSASVSYAGINLTTGEGASGTVSTDLPAAATFLSSHVYCSINSGTTAAAIDVGRIYLETDL